MYYDGENIAHVLFSRVIAYDPVTRRHLLARDWKRAWSGAMRRRR